MKSKIYKLSSLFGAIFFVCVSGHAQFSVSGPLTGTTSPGPITVHNGLYLGNGASGNASNVAISGGALPVAAAGVTNNVAIGPYASFSNTSAANNTAIGYGSLQWTTGTENIGIGVFSLRGTQNFATGTHNIGIGSYALYSYRAAGNNVAIGFESMRLDSIGVHNVGVGVGSLKNNIASNNNTAIGTSSLTNFVGADASLPGTWGYNTGSGASSLGSLTRGTNNTAMGMRAGFDLLFGSNNVAIGSYSVIPNGNGTGTNYNSNNLTIQNSIYGINMPVPNSTGTDLLTGNIGIGVIPSVLSGGIASGIAKLHISGVGGIKGSPAAAPSLQLDYVPSVANPGNKYLYVDVNGVVGQDVLPGVTGINQCDKVNFVPVTDNVNGNMKCSTIYDNGTYVGINVGSIPTAQLDVECASSTGPSNFRLRHLTSNVAENELKTLIIDPDGYVFVGTSSNDRSMANNQLIQQQQLQIANLQSELNDLKTKLNQLVPGCITVKEDYFQINPNPVTDFSTVSYKLTSDMSNPLFTVYDLQGQTIKKFNVSTKQGQFKISKNDLGNGMYILSLSSNNTEIQSMKFIISH